MWEAHAILMIFILEACWAAGIKVFYTRHVRNGCVAATSWRFPNQKPGVFVAASGQGGRAATGSDRVVVTSYVLVEGV